MLAVRTYDVLSAVDTAFWVFRSNARLLASLGAVLGSVNIAFGVAMLYLGPDPRLLAGDDPNALLLSLAEKAGLLLLTMIVTVIVGVLGTSAATRIATQLVLGKEASLGDAIRVAFERFLPLLGATLISSLGIGLGMVFLFIPGLYIALALAFVAPVIVTERSSATESLGRSWRLSKGQKWKLLLSFILLGIVLGALGLGLDLILRLFFKVENAFTLQLASTIFNGVLNAMLSPVYYLVVVLLYFGARVEHEAFDVHMLTEASTA